MKNPLPSLLMAILASSQAACHAAEGPAVVASTKAPPAGQAPDVNQYASQRGWLLRPTKSLPLPVTDVRPVVYTEKGGAAPGCGLLARTGAGTEFFEILSPEEGMGFPQCLAINDVAAFNLRNRQYLVFEYINRDTREDFYRQYCYLYRGPAGRYVADDELNDSMVWTEPLRAMGDKINSPQAQEGVRRAKGTLLSKSVAGMRFLERDFIAGSTSAFAVFHDSVSGQCVFVTDAAGRTRLFSHDIFSRGEKWESVLAASNLEHNGVTYYLALFKGPTRNHISAVSVASGLTVAEACGAALAAARKRNLIDMKTAKEAFKSSL